MDIETVSSAVTAVATVASAVLALLCYRRLLLKDRQRFHVKVEQHVLDDGTRRGTFFLVNEGERTVTVRAIGLRQTVFGREVGKAEESVEDETEPGALRGYDAARMLATVKDHPFLSVRPYLVTANDAVVFGKKLDRDDLRPARKRGKDVSRSEQCLHG